MNQAPHGLRWCTRHRPRHRILSTMAACLVLGTGIVHRASAREPVTRGALDQRAGAWDRSVRLEKQGKLAQARAELLRAWGTSPEGYEVTVRLAWLSLRLGDSDKAIVWYGRARSLPGAGLESTRGLASAHTQRGFARLERHERHSARQDFRTALALDAAQADARRGLAITGPESRVDPELWLAYLQHSLPKAKWRGAALFAHLPWHVDDTWRLRLAYRYLALETDYQTEDAPPGGPRLGDVNTSEHQQELYMGVRFGSPWVDFEALGAAVLPSNGDKVPGAGVELRAGKRFGLLVEGASLGRESGWNHQAIPGLYYWPTDSIGFAVGTRYTTDAVGNALSAWAGVSWCDDRSELHIRGHRGAERWAFSIRQPSILTIDSETTAGGRATLLLPLSRMWQLGLMGELEKLNKVAEPGVYFDVGLGLVWSPYLGKTEPNTVRSGVGIASR